MDLDLTDFTPDQQHALFDLLILAMYADGHLTTVADEELGQVLAAMGLTAGADRQREFDAVVSRLHPLVQSIWRARQEAIVLANAFTTRSQQKRVYEAVLKMMAADQHVSSWEGALMMELRMKFRL